MEEKQLTRKEQYLTAISKGDTLNLPEPYTREEKLLKAIAERVGLGGGISTTELNNRILALYPDVENLEKIRQDVESMLEEDYSFIEDYPTYVYNQDTFDDMLEEKTGEMLRTDTCVVNQFCFGASGAGSPVYNALGFNPSESYENNTASNNGWSGLTRYKYFYWDDVEKLENGEVVYDFDNTIGKFAKACYDSQARTGIRIFVNESGDSGDSRNHTVGGNTYTTRIPTHVLSKMIASPQWFEAYKGGNVHDYLHTDWNVDEVREDYINLIEACGAWLDTATFVGKDNTTRNVKDIIVYIDMGTYGPWGEGAVYNWNFMPKYDDPSRDACTPSDLVAISNAYVTSFPNTQINHGQWFQPINESMDIASAYNQKVIKLNERAIGTHNLYNNAGHVGMFLDNLGANNPLFSKDYKLDAEGHTFIENAKAWGERGDFFTGEFAIMSHKTGESKFGTEQGLHALKVFKLFKAPHFRFHNMTDSTEAKDSEGKSSYHIYIAKDEKKVWLDLTRALACVGGRFVVLPVSVDFVNQKAYFRLTNIGLTPAAWDIFDIKIRVRNLNDTTEYIDLVPTNIPPKPKAGQAQEEPKIINLTEIYPKTEPLLYSASNGEVFQCDISQIEYSDYTISIIGVDKLGFPRGMYFSNYNRNGDGSYLLFTVSNGEATPVRQNIMSLRDIISKTATEAANSAYEYLKNEIQPMITAYTTKALETTDNMWTLKYRDKMLTSNGTIVQSSAFRIFERECAEGDVFEAVQGSYLKNGVTTFTGINIPNSGSTLIFYDRLGNIIEGVRYTDFAQKDDGSYDTSRPANGAQIVAPAGAVKVYLQMFYGDATWVNPPIIYYVGNDYNIADRILHKKAVRQPVNYAASIEAIENRVSALES